MGQGTARGQRGIFNFKLKAAGSERVLSCAGLARSLGSRGRSASRISGPLGERSLPGGLPFLGHRQQALGRDALVRHDAEEFAGRHTGVFSEHLKVRSGGEPFAQFPQVDGIQGEAQVGGDLFKGDPFLPTPILEGNREAGADVALEFGFLGHAGSLDRVRVRSKRGGGG
jgi:hypothetical protein